MRKSVLVLLFILSLVLAACGPAMAPAAGPETDSGEVFMVALPQVVIDFDAQGNPSIMGVRLADLGPFIGLNVANLRLNPFYVNWMTATNVQHIEMRQTGSGVVMFVNGKPLPYLGWSDASLSNVGDVAAMFNMQNTDTVSKFVPIIRRLGLDLVLQFPRNPGTAAVPLVNPDEALKLAAAPATQPAVAIVKFEVKYGENGTPAILGITPRDLANLGISTGGLNLAPDVLQNLKANNIQNIELRSKNDGLYVYVNGQALPNVVWDDQFLGNAADLYAQMNPQSPYITLVRQFIPMVNRADVAVMIHFPLAPGATPITAKMH